MPKSRSSVASARRREKLLIFLWLTLMSATWSSVARASATSTPSFGEGGAVEDPIAMLKQRYGYVWHSIQLPVCGVHVVVHYLPGDEAWAQDIAQTVLSALPLAEQLTGTPLPTRDDIHLWEVHQSDLGLAGQNIRNVGILLAREQDVVTHELAHYWVGSHNLSEHWMAEGLAELYDHLIRLRMKGRPWSPPNLFELRAMNEFDGPLALWRRLDHIDATVQQREINRFFYGKAFLFWYNLERYYGPRFIREIQQWIRNSSEPRDSAALLGFLQGLERPGTPTIWELYPGWLVDGEYRLKEREFSFEWFLGDEDDDGVSNLEELITGLDHTNRDTDGDGYGDGWELFEGRDPAKPEAGPRGNATWVIPQWAPSPSHRFVRAGERIHVRAHGFWRMSKPIGQWFGADGMESDPSPNQRWGELVAQIGLGPFAGRVHRLGSDASFVADRDGLLYFMARGTPHQAGREGLLVTVDGGHQLPLLREGSPRLELKKRLKISRKLREQGITELELRGKHVTLVLAPSDLASMATPNEILAYLDQVYETYVEMLGEAPYGGRRILLNFDVTTRDRIHFEGSSMALTFGLEHLRAALKYSSPCRATWGLTYGMAMPFLEWYQADTLLEPKAAWAMAELMAARLFEDYGVRVPTIGPARERLLSYRDSPKELERLKDDKRLLWTFLFSLYCDFGWTPFRATLENARAIAYAGLAHEISKIPLEDFLIEFGRAAGVDISQRCHAWGFPLTGRIRQALEPLPPSRAPSEAKAPHVDAALPDGEGLSSSLKEARVAQQPVGK